MAGSTNSSSATSSRGPFTPEQRTAILLVVQQELPYEDIAAIMGAPVSSVKTWIHRARAQLRELMKDFHPDA